MSGVNKVVNKKEHFIFLEWLRFFLGIYIILFHTMHYNIIPTWFRSAFDMGFFATSTFFILSGFLLSHVYLKEHTKPTVHLRESPRSFIIKRFSNLYPIHIISMVLMIVVILFISEFDIIPNDAKSSIRFIMYDVNNSTPGKELAHLMSNTEVFIALIMNIFMIQSWNPYYISFNFPAWSIATLFFFYLLFPYIAPRLHRVKRPLLALLINNLVYLTPVVLIILYTDFGMPETGLLHRNPIIRLPEFIAGILLCSLYHKHKEVGVAPSSLLKAFLWMFIGGSLYGANYLLAIAPTISAKGNIPYYLLHDGLLLSAEVALIYLCTQINYKGSEKFQKISERLGGSSLPLFALHIPLYMTFERIEYLILGHKSLYSYPIYLIVTVILCVLFQEKVVVRIRKIIQHRLLKK